MADDEVWKEFQRRYGPGGKGPAEPAPGPGAPGKPARPGAAPPASAADVDAWSAFVEDFHTPAAPKAPKTPPRPPPTPKKRGLSEADTGAWASFVADLEAGRAAPPPEREPPPPPPPPAARRAPEPPPSREVVDVAQPVDLHGKSRKEAASILERRLLEGRRLGLDSLLVITGRGLHSAGAPVLRAWLPDWAAKHATGAPLPCEEVEPGVFRVGVR